MSQIGRIRRVSAVMKHVCTIGILAIPGGLAVFWITAEPDTLRSLPGVTFDIAALPPVTRVLAFLAMMVPGAIGIYGLAMLRRLFDAYRHGEIFAVDNPLRLRAFAFSVLAASVAKLALVPVLSVVLSWHNPPGTRALSIAFSSDDVGTLFVGFLFLMVAWIMAEAQRIAEDNAQIV